MKGNEMTTDLVPTTGDGNTILAIIERASSSDDFDVAKMAQLMELKRDWDKDRAAEAYGKAIAEFQRKCPQIVKERKADAGSLKYQYASFDDVMKKAGPVLAECGIAVSFSTEANDKGIRVTVKMRVGIHAEECTLDVPVPDMKVNSTQRYGAALSYAKRYALCAALNIVVTDEDDDAQSAYDPISEEQELELTSFMDDHNLAKEPFLKWLGVDRICDIPAADYEKAMSGLRSKARAK